MRFVLLSFCLFLVAVSCRAQEHHEEVNKLADMLIDSVKKSADKEEELPELDLSDLSNLDIEMLDKKDLSEDLGTDTDLEESEGDEAEELGKRGRRCRYRLCTIPAIIRHRPHGRPVPIYFTYRCKRYCRG